MDSKTWMWPQANNETPMVGRKVLVFSDGETKPIVPFGLTLMLPLYSTVAEWVRESDLTPYPASPIEEPSK